MSGNSLRNFTVRFLESALRRVESTAKPYYGGRLSTGEAIRRLAEERLNQIENDQPRESEQEVLLRILRAWRSGRPLGLADLHWVATCAHLAYQLCKKDSISRALLIANVSAFREAVQLTMRGKTSKAIEPEHRYYVGNLGTSKHIEARSLVDYLDQWIESLSEWPSPRQAEFASCNLMTFLDGEEQSDTSQLGKVLNPYLSDLLQVAIRGYWYSAHQPLLEAQSAFGDSRPLFPGTVRDGKISLTPILQDHELILALEFTDRELVITTSNFVETEELSELTHRAVNGHYGRGESFTWLKQPGPTHDVILASHRVRQSVTIEELTSVDKCLQSFLNEPSVRALAERLSFVYGRI